ncbi:MAG: AAA family ATPase [Chloroflexota bacterium]
MTQPGKIILINGASSAGKSTLARAVQQQFPLPLLHISFDLFIDGDILPKPQIRDGTFSWQAMRPTVFDGYFRCWAALALAGNHLVIDHIIETEASLRYILQLLAGIDVFFVALHCSLEELERREEARGDRRSGDARTDLAIVHRYTRYDLELHSDKATVAENVVRLIAAWGQWQHPTAFKQMTAEMFG